MKRATVENFDSFISDSPQDLAELNPNTQAPQAPNDSVAWVEEFGEKPLKDSLETFSQNLVKYFDKLFYSVMKNVASYPPSVYFSIKKARLISKNISQLTLENIEQLIGGEMLPGQMSMLMKHVELFRLDKSYQDSVRIEEDAEAELIRKAKRLRSEKEAEENQKIEARKMVREAAALRKVETAARVAKKSEVRRVAKEAKRVENERKKRKKDSNMAMLLELKAQAGFTQEVASNQTSNGPIDSTIGSVSGSVDPSLL
jgi:hypothetical protein